MAAEAFAIAEPGPRAGVGTERLAYGLIALFAMGVNIEVKGLLPPGLGPMVESALRWLPGLALSLCLLLWHRPWSGLMASPLLALVLLAIGQSAVLSPVPQRSLIELLRELPVWLTLMAVIAGTLDEARLWRSLMLALSAFCALSVLTALAVPEHGWMNHEWGPSQWRLRGIAPQAVTFAFVAGLAVVLSGWHLLHARGGGLGWHAMLAMLVAVNLWAFMAAGSRGPWLGLLPAMAVLTVLPLVAAAPVLRAVALLVLVVVLPAAYAAVYIYTHALPLDVVIAFAEADGSPRMMTLVERALIWAEGRADIARAPLLGSGYHTGIAVDHHLADDDGAYPSLHALFLAIWHGSGAVAMLALVAMLFGGWMLNAVLCTTGPVRSLALLRLAVLGFVLGCGLFDAPLRPAVILLGGLAAWAFTVRRAPCNG